MVDHSFFRTNFGTKIGYVPLARKLKTWPGRKLCMVIYVPVALFSSKALYSCKKSSLKFGVQMVVPVPVRILGDNLKTWVSDLGSMSYVQIKKKTVQNNDI